jgi:hypothetical protein
LSQGGTDRRHLQICQSFLSDTQKDTTVNKTKQNKADQSPKKKKERKKNRKRFCKTPTTAATSTKTRRSSSATTIMIQTPNY